MLVISQVKVIDKNRLIEKISKVNTSIIEEAENNLMFILGITKI